VKVSLNTIWVPDVELVLLYRGQLSLSSGHIVFGLPVSTKERRYFCIMTAIVALTELEPMPAPPAPGPVLVVELELVVEFEKLELELETAMAEEVDVELSVVVVVVDVEERVYVLYQ